MDESDKRKGIGGFFDHLSKATQKPLFGLGVGLLSGNPQQGFRNAQSLSRDQNSLLKDDESLREVVALVLSLAKENKTENQIFEEVKNRRPQ